MSTLAAVVGKVLEYLRGPDRRVGEAMTAQRTMHKEALAAVRDTRAAAESARDQADEVVNEARRAERILEGNQPYQ